MTPSPSRCSPSRPLVISALALFLVYQFATYKGLPIVLVVMGMLIALFVFVTKRMTIGRRIYAMGGNAKAAQLSGIKTERLTLIVFINMGVLSALGGLIIAARLGQAVPAAGLGSELDVIAAVFIGGASAMGGVGQVIGRGGRRLHHGRHEQRHVDHGRQRRLAAGGQGPGAARRRGLRRLQQEQGLSRQGESPPKRLLDRPPVRSRAPDGSNRDLIASCRPRLWAATRKFALQNARLAATNRAAARR